METDEPFRLLFVCTGNVCRSPAAEILMRHQLRGRLGGREAARIAVASAGVRAVVGGAMHPAARAELAPWGLHVDDRSGRFRARQLTAEVIAGTDLVLTATPRHRSLVLEEFPEMLGATFALREFARLVGTVDTVMLPPDLVKRARELVRAARDRRGLAPVTGDDRVPDPIGCGPDAFRTATELTFHALVEVLDVVAPHRRPA